MSLRSNRFFGPRDGPQNDTKARSNDDSPFPNRAEARSASAGGSRCAPPLPARKPAAAPIRGPRSLARRTRPMV